MYLKRLELQGFKSFADKTVLDFGHGVTTVVGPNGSGKSNISDAIRWVMGEMSAKSLRGANMQDVIFAGTETRKKVNFAEVSLVLDNSDRMFPIAFDEIVVTRKVFRSGETVYQINHSDCRLRDIHELFMDTGLGRDGYSMIGQGNVAQILSRKAEDRRSFFEDAAGVSKYKHRKDEALRKLSSVNDNLLRINDIALELERQLGPLETQSKKARKYLVLYEEYKGLDVNMCLINLEKNIELLNAAKELYQSIFEEIQELKSKETEIEARQNDLYLKSTQKDEELAKKNDELIENESKSMSASNEITITENNIKNNELMIERINAEISSIDKQIENSKMQIELFEKSILDKETEKKDLMNRFEIIQKLNSEVFEKLNSLRDEIDSLKNSLVTKTNDLSSLKAQIEGIEALRSNILKRRDAVENELKTQGSCVTNIKSDIESTKKTIEEKSEKAQSMKARVDTLNDKLENFTQEYKKINDEITDIQVKLNSKASQKKILEGMENDYEGFSKSVKSIMTSDTLKNAAIYGTVSRLITVSKEYAVAIETALGGAMQNIVVESEDDAKKAIRFLKDTKGGRATFLPISAVSFRELDNVKDIAKNDGYIGIASELIQYNKQFDSVMKSLLSRVVVIDNMDNAVSVAKKYSYKFKIVTIDGELLNPGGSISGGSVNKSSGFLSRAADIKLLSSEISELKSKIDELNQKKDSFDSDITNIKNQLSNYTPLLREYENEILVAKNSLEHLENSLSDSSDSEKILSDELVNIQQELSESADKIAGFINNVRFLERDIESTNNLISEKTVNLNTVTEEKDQRTKELMDETLHLRTLEKDIETDKQSIENTNNDIQNYTNLRISKLNDKQDLIIKNEELVAGISSKTSEIESIKEISVKIKEEIEEIEKEKQAIVEGLKDITINNKDLTDKLITLQQELMKAENKQNKIETDSENIVNRLWDEYELTPNSAAEIKTEIEDVSIARDRVQELKGKIKALGSVNLESIDEYISSKERFDFLTEQKADLEKAQDNLNKVISSMQELMEEHFKVQFEEINKAFSRVFNELFGGGRGRLYLSDPEDIMDSGIEIEVQLPGKGLQNINLYSGGEKSFIAIALLFAILEVKPTPFCFLDEIDAALDDVNVSRFATYLKNYLNATQFIVITHRRGTMESANIMYGVTMQEKGVSKLLSLQIDDVDDEMLN